MESLVPLAMLTAIGLATAGLVWWAVRDLVSTWTGRGQGRGSPGGGGLVGGMMEIDRLVRPSVVHVEQIREEAESEQENDGE